MYRTVITLTRSDQNDPWFYDVRENVLPGAASLEQQMIDAGLMTITDERSDTTYTRTIDWGSDVAYAVYRRIQSIAYPSYLEQRDAWLVANNQRIDFLHSDDLTIIDNYTESQRDQIELQVKQFIT